MTRKPLDDVGLNLLFTDARTHYSWHKKVVHNSLLRQIFNLMRMAPTSANCSPARLIFITTADGKEKLRPALSEGNLQQTMSAPVTVIISNDMRFYEHLPHLFPHADAQAWFADDDGLIEETAFRNGTLQGAYLMMAARALGLDCGPMSGFDVEKMNSIFFPGGRFKVNFLCNIGYGDDSQTYKRTPRFSFSEVCQVI